MNDKARFVEKAMNPIGKLCAGIWLAASAAGACAQPGVRVLGVADGDAVLDAGCARVCVRGASFGAIATVARPGARRTEPLGPGMQAVFGVDAGGLPAGWRAQDQAGLFERQSYVGLVTRGTAITVGRQYSLDYLALVDVADPFGGGLAAVGADLMPGGARRLDNSIRVEHHAAGGWVTAATMGLGQQVGDLHANRAWGISLGITRGRFTLRVAHQNRNVTHTNQVMPVPDSSDQRSSVIAANWNLGSLVAYAGFDVNRGSGDLTLWNPDRPYSAAVPTTPSRDSRDLLLGVAVPRGPTTWLASWIRKNDRDLVNHDADQVAFGVTEALTRRTDVYAAVSRMWNRGAGGSGAVAGGGDKAINIGLRHAF
jgi:predicted porin